LIAANVLVDHARCEPMNTSTVERIAPIRTATVSMKVLPTNFSDRVATRNRA
jgi:hypothetical protein